MRADAKLVSREAKAADAIAKGLHAGASDLHARTRRGTTHASLLRAIAKGLHADASDVHAQTRRGTTPASLLQAIAKAARTDAKLRGEEADVVNAVAKRPRARSKDLLDDSSSPRTDSKCVGPPTLDNGRFEIVVEPLEAPDPGADALETPERRLRVWRG